MGGARQRGDRGMKHLASLLALVCAQAFAYVGSFEPTPIRNVATVTFIDSQLAGATCAIEAAKVNPIYAALTAPLTLQVTACAIMEPPTVIAPISPGIGSLYALQILATPDALLGHETRHIFDGQFHLPMLPFVDSGWLRSERCSANRGVPGEQPTADVRPTAERSAQQLRVPAKDENVCVIFVDDCSVSYSDFGELVRKCLE